MPEPLTGEALKKQELENAPRSEQLIADWSQEDDCDYSKANIKFCSELEKINALRSFHSVFHTRKEDYQERRNVVLDRP